MLDACESSTVGGETHGIFLCKVLYHSGILLHTPGTGECASVSYDALGDSIAACCHLTI